VGKILHRSHEWIAAVSASSGHLKLVIGFFQSALQMVASSDRWARHRHGNPSIEHQVLRQRAGARETLESCDQLERNTSPYVPSPMPAWSLREWVFRIGCSLTVRFFNPLVPSKSGKCSRASKASKRSNLSGRGKFQPSAQRRPHQLSPPLLPRRATSNSREPTLFCRVQKARSSWTVAIEGGSISSVA